MPSWWLKRKVRQCECTVRGGLSVQGVCLRNDQLEVRTTSRYPSLFWEAVVLEERTSALLWRQAHWELSPGSHIYSCVTSEKLLYLSEKWDNIMLTFDCLPIFAFSSWLLVFPYGLDHCIWDPKLIYWKPHDKPLYVAHSLLPLIPVELNGRAQAFFMAVPIITIKFLSPGHIMMTAPPEKY